MINNLDDIQNILKEDMDNLVEEFNISLIYVFGSFAKGDNTKSSDIDVAFLLNKDIDGYTKLNLLGKLVDIFKREDIDLVILNQVNEILQFQVIKYGKIIYMDSLYNKVVYESRTMSKYMDMEHFRKTQQKYSHERFLDIMK